MLRQVISSSGNVGRQAVRQNVSSLVLKRNGATVAASQSIQDEWESAKPFEEVPGPKPLPIIGNFWRFLPLVGTVPGDFKEFEDYFYKNYGNICKLSSLLGRNDMVLVYNPDDCEKVYRNEGPWPARQGMKSMEYYRNVTRKDMFEGVAGSLIAQGKEWHDFRSKVNPIMLQPRATKLYIHPIDGVASDFIQRIRSIRDDKLEMPSDFANEICKWALESIVYIALDTRLGCLSNDLKPDSEPQKMIDAVNTMLDSLFYLDFRLSPWRLISTPRWRKFVKASDYFNEVCLKYISQAMERLKNLKDSDRELTVLEKLLARDSNPKTAMVMALDMMTGGVDTTSFTAATVLYYLAKNPNKQEKLFEETAEYIKDKDQPVTSEILNELKYLKACVKEGIRMRPVINGVVRTLPKDVVLGGYRIPKGTDAVLLHAYLGRMEKNFHKADEFIPERWLKTDGNRSEAQETHAFVYLPFGHGPRSCLGRRFAQLELETLLAKIIRNFHVGYNHGEIKFVVKFLVTPVSPLKFKFVDRN